MNKRNWITVDLDGLSKTLSRNGKNFILSELLRNAWDEDGVTQVHVTSQDSDRRQMVLLTVADDSPSGFRDLADAHTLFAESYKKSDATKAGRFNSGDKLVLAMCESARIVSTTGTVTFNADGTRTKSSKKSERGSSIELVVRMTVAEHEELCEFAKTLLAPRGITTTFNGDYLAPRRPVASLKAKLTTEIANGEGILRKLKRETIVEVLEPREGESPTLHELGIPVMPLDCKWHVNIQQKVPLTMERDSVPPSYLRDISALIVNELYASLNAEEATANWVTEGVGSKCATPEAVTKVMDLRFGEKRVAFDPSDTEANRTAASKGFTVVHGGSLPKEVWQNVKRDGAVKPAGQQFPTYKPYGEGGTPAQFIDQDKWTAGMRNITYYIECLGYRILQRKITVRFEKGRFTAPFTANYNRDSGTLTWNYDKCGKAAFDKSRSDEWLNDIIIHEFAHQYGNHLEKKFDDAMSRIGSELLTIALKEPKLFK